MIEKHQRIKNLQVNDKFINEKTKNLVEQEFKIMEEEGNKEIFFLLLSFRWWLLIEVLSLKLFPPFFLFLSFFSKKIKRPIFIFFYDIFCYFFQCSCYKSAKHLIGQTQREGWFRIILVQKIICLILEMISFHEWLVTECVWITRKHFVFHTLRYKLISCWQ